MNTEMLIAQLSSDLRPVPIGAPRTLLGTGLLTGAAVAAIGLLAWPSLSVRPDLGAALLTWIFWVKLLYTGALALLGMQALARLSRPAIAPVGWAGLLGPPLSTLALFTALRFIAAPAATPASFWMGTTWLQCPLYIAALSIPILCTLLLSLSRLAPTRLAEAGAAAGLVAGGTGAALYTLHCPEGSPGFVLLWYSAGTGAACLFGAAIGSRMLRW